MRLSPKCRSIISGQRRGIGPGFVRLLLRGASLLYGWAIFLRNWLYDVGWLRSARLDVAVVCVGNLTAGGTGKTPMVVWLCRQLQQRDVRPAVLSRGYQAVDGADNDEIKLFRVALPDVPIVVDSDRVRGGRYAIERYEAQVLVLDDGFQHRRLVRDFDIVLIDCTCPFGYDAMLPRGLLRESPRELRRAQVAVLTRTDQVDQAQTAELAQRASYLLGSGSNEGTEKLLAFSTHRPTALYRADGNREDVETLKDRTVAAFCGIGNPQAFVTTLCSTGAVIAAERFFDDHHHYDDDDYLSLLSVMRETQAELLVTTEKDWVKLKELPRAAAATEVRWLGIETEITQGQGEMSLLLDRLADSVKADDNNV